MESRSILIYRSFPDCCFLDADRQMLRRQDAPYMNHGLIGKSCGLPEWERSTTRSTTEYRRLSCASCTSCVPFALPLASGYRSNPSVPPMGSRTITSTRSTVTHLDISG